MITKLCHFPAVADTGERLAQVFRPGHMGEAETFFGMGKTAAPLLPAVRAFLEKLRPDARKIYVLVNALGAGEYWSSNINGDYFPEVSLIHTGPIYGYETFYSAHPFMHHVNKDPAKSFGQVALSVWNDSMKRAELVVEIDRDKADRVGATSVCDKIDHDIFSDVSMGCRVPYDLCSICTDWAEYKKAQGTYDKDKHKSVGAAVVEYHKQHPIRGLSITRNDYCDHLRKTINKILPDGRKIYAINDYPCFFDISFVFIGADKTAKVMAKLAEAPLVQDSHITYASIEELLTGMAKVASTDPTDDVRDAVNPLKTGTVGKLVSRKKYAAQIKASEILKDVVPSQFGGKVVRLDEGNDLPNDILDFMGKDPSRSLSTAASMGMLMRPREFQRIIIISSGDKSLADKLDSEGKVFGPTDAETDVPGLGSHNFSSMIKSILMPFLEDRSVLEPVAKRKIVRITITGMPKAASRELEFDDTDPFLQKISAAYNGYLDGAVRCLRDCQSHVDRDGELYSAVYGTKLATAMQKEAEKVNPAVLLGSVGGAYALSQYADWERQRAMMGAREPVGPVTSLAASHPKALMLLAAIAALQQQGSTIPNQLLAGLRTAVGRASERYV
jgi:hypothetical protein